MILTLAPSLVKLKNSNFHSSCFPKNYSQIWEQYAHLFASLGISLRHSLHFLVFESNGGSFLALEINKFIGLITKKKIEADIKTKDNKELIKLPYINLLSLILKYKPEKSGVLAIAAIKGVIKSVTKEDTIVPKAAPTTTPTARSTTFPLNKNCLNSFNITIFYHKTKNHTV